MQMNVILLYVSCATLLPWLIFDYGIIRDIFTLLCDKFPSIPQHAFILDRDSNNYQCHLSYLQPLLLYGLTIFMILYHYALF